MLLAAEPQRNGDAIAQAHTAKNKETKVFKRLSVKVAAFSVTFCTIFFCNFFLGGGGDRERERENHEKVQTPL